MDPVVKRGRLLRFSIFELDREAGELFKQGRKINCEAGRLSCWWRCWNGGARS